MIALPFSVWAVSKKQGCERAVKFVKDNIKHLQSSASLQTWKPTSFQCQTSEGGKKNYIKRKFCRTEIKDIISLNLTKLFQSFTKKVPNQPKC